MRVLTCGFCILLTTDIVPKISPNLNVITHLVVPAGWGSCLPRLTFLLLLLTGTRDGEDR